MHRMVPVGGKLQCAQARFAQRHKCSACARASSCLSLSGHSSAVLAEKSQELGSYSFVNLYSQELPVSIHRACHARRISPRRRHVACAHVRCGCAIGDAAPRLKYVCYLDQITLDECWNTKSIL